MTILSSAQKDILHAIKRREAPEARQGRSVQILLSAGFIQKLPYTQRLSPDHKYGLTELGKRVVQDD